MHIATGKNKQNSYDGDYMNLGKIGEEKVITFLKSRKEIKEIIDYRDDKEMQKRDVDIGIITDKESWAEIKTDSYLGKSGNILNEMLRINHTSNTKFAGYLGWTLRSAAKWLLFYAPNTNPPSIWRAKFEDIRRIIQKYTHDNNAYFNIVRTDKIKTTYNLLIPYINYTNIFEIYKLE